MGMCIPQPIVSYSLFCKGWQDIPFLVDELPQVAIEWFSRAGLNICNSSEVRILAATMTVDELSDDQKSRFSKLINRDCMGLPKGMFYIGDDLSNNEDGDTEKIEKSSVDDSLAEIPIEEIEKEPYIKDLDKLTF